MSEPQKHSDNPGETPELLERPEVIEAEGSEEKIDETIDHPAKVMRIGTMMKQLLDEARATDLDEPSRDRLRDVYETSIAELGVALSADLREELGRLVLPFGSDDTPSGAELQIAKAQLVGWLEGLVQGMQAMLFAQQMAAQQQLQSMRGQIGPPQSDRSASSDERPGTYL
ncbi:MAG: DUF2587 domain-containing protein [Acidimicrobiaceae bacterium]|nr:DUF2587 domain-containing protein [Acidimicrobiaceae bacterium]